VSEAARFLAGSEEKFHRKALEVEVPFDQVCALAMWRLFCGRKTEYHTSVLYG
jgi:hypothetical protein